jgi:hypothetical protein
MRAKLTLLLLGTPLLLLALALYLGVLRVPDRWNPWSPLVIADPPNLLTRYKLSRLSSDAALCRSVLEQSSFRYQWVPDRTTGPACGLSNALRVEATSAAVGTPFVLSCRSAVTLALWEQHVLQPQALTHFGRPVARLQHFGSYSCRNVNGADDAPRSQHATADALDLAGFVLSDGRHVRVLADWTGEKSEAKFLRDIHAGACRFFDAALGPDYNAAHRDHLHFDRGSYRACR